LKSSCWPSHISHFRWPLTLALLTLGVVGGFTGCISFLFLLFRKTFLSTQWFSSLPPLGLMPSVHLKRMSPQNRIRIGIIEAGIAGLAAAVALRRAGHHAQVRYPHLRHQASFNSGPVRGNYEYLTKRPPLLACQSRYSTGLCSGTKLALQ
jgi:hypothetical protein